MSLCVWVSVRYLELSHRLDQGVHGHENVPEDEVLVLEAVLLGVAFPVDDSHLFDECALSRFTCA